MWRSKFRGRGNTYLKLKSKGEEDSGFKVFDQDFNARSRTIGEVFGKNKLRF